MMRSSKSSALARRSRGLVGGIDLGDLPLLRVRRLVAGRLEIDSSFLSAPILPANQRGVCIFESMSRSRVTRVSSRWLSASS